MYRISEKNTVDAGQTYWTQDQKVSHIIPDVLYPALNGKLLDGSTSHSGAYGTAQSDGRMYYYTDIRGSKSIKDPRIGAHFGSQRHKFRSLQKLEQETATHGVEGGVNSNIFSIDGREWIRANLLTVLEIQSNQFGTYVPLWRGTAAFVEITAYFSSLNIIVGTATANHGYTVGLDGAAAVASTNHRTSLASPLSGRYVDSGSVSTVVSTTLGLHTVRIQNNANNKDVEFYGIELITQDTSNRNNIQIPSQNVVSYGKKFTVSGTPHYDPFNGFVNDTSLFADFVDMDTSLGLGTGTTWGAAWDKGSSNHIRPYNGGRVVKWVDSSGVIKTSVNMMPANAQKGVGSGAHAEITTPSATNTAYLPAFSDDAVDHSLAEVAKTMHFREFGNGSSNGGTTGTYADASMIDTTVDNIAYTMDDGLTSLVGDQTYAVSGTYLRPSNSQNYHGYYITFIGTGFTLHVNSPSSYPPQILAQNLPYGTHVIHIHGTLGVTDTRNMYVDGVVVFTGHTNLNNFPPQKLYLEEATFHQPKMPPIPKNAVVLADYMLMADFVAQTPAQNDGNRISKGTRLISCSRDFKYDTTGGSNYAAGTCVPIAEAWTAHCHTGMAVFFNGENTDVDVTLPYFGDTSGEFATRGVGDGAPIHVNLTNSSGTLETTNVTLASNLTISSQPTVPQGGSSAANIHTFSKSDGVLGLNQVKFNADGSVNSTYDWLYFGGMAISTPIHTSSHYQPFETPWLYELVGGDRNMEQTNLVVTGDGKTWDEVTRDTSYIGNVVLSGNSENTLNAETAVFFEDWRGRDVSSPARTHQLYGNKDFAIARDRYICLRPGTYSIHLCSISAAINVPNNHCMIWVNGVNVAAASTGSNGWQQSYCNIPIYLKRGDYVEIRGRFYGGSGNYNQFRIHRMPELKKKYDKIDNKSTMNHRQIQKLNYGWN